MQTTPILLGTTVLTITLGSAAASAGFHTSELEPILSRHPIHGAALGIEPMEAPAPVLAAFEGAFDEIFDKGPDTPLVGCVRHDLTSPEPQHADDNPASASSAHIGDARIPGSMNEMNQDPPRAEDFETQSGMRDLRVPDLASAF